MVLDHLQVWGKCLKSIREAVGDQAYNTWFEPIIPLKLEDKVLTIQVPSQFFYEWLEEHYVYILREVINHQLGVEGKLEYSIVIDRGDNDSKPFTINIPTSKRPDIKSKKEDNNGQFQDIKDIFKYDFQLNRNYTFDTFITISWISASLPLPSFARQLPELCTSSSFPPSPPASLSSFCVLS